MNKYDRENYHFIMSLTPKEFDEWYKTISDDDAAYAMELIQQARTELAEQSASLFDDITSFKEARKLLKKFTLKGVIRTPSKKNNG
jgi:hypothetical protein